MISYYQVNHIGALLDQVIKLIYSVSAFVIIPKGFPIKGFRFPQNLEANVQSVEGLGRQNFTHTKVIYS